MGYKVKKWFGIGAMPFGVQNIHPERAPLPCQPHSLGVFLRTYVRGFLWHGVNARTAVFTPLPLSPHPLLSKEGVRGR